MWSASWRSSQGTGSSSGSVFTHSAGQYYCNICFDEDSSLADVFILSGSSVVASWTFTFKDASSNLWWKYFNYVFDIITILYTSRLKAHGSNPLQ